MKNIIKLVCVFLVVIVSLTWIAVADPSRIDIKPGDDSNPLTHPLDGSTRSYDVRIYEMVVQGTRYIEIRASSGLTSARLYGNGVDITATSGSSDSQTWNVPSGVMEQMFTLEVTTSSPGEVTILNNAGTTLLDSSVAVQDFGGAANSFDIPEFPTVALPVMAAIGLMFFLQHRKRKEE